MTSKPLVIFGTGEMAEVAQFYFRHDSDRAVAAFCVDGDRASEDSFHGCPVVAFEDLGKDFGPATHDLFVAIGYSKINKVREAKCAAGRDAGYDLASYVSSKATTFPDLSHGSNCFILEDNTIQPFVRIGDGVTLWSGNHIGHHATIGDFAFLTSHVVVSGGVSVGARSFIGVNSSLNDHISVGADCVIGSGCLVPKSLEDETVVTAEPAKLSRVPSSRLKGF